MTARERRVLLLLVSALQYAMRYMAPSCDYTICHAALDEFDRMTKESGNG